MEPDKHIKQLLLNSAEGASADFTDAVLKRITDLSAVRLYHQPLIPLKWQRRFLYTFGAIVITIIALCLVMAATPIAVVNWIKGWELPEIGYNKIVLFIFCFWIVFVMNALLEKRFLPTRRDL